MNLPCKALFTLSVSHYEKESRIRLLTHNTPITFPISAYMCLQAVFAFFCAVFQIFAQVISWRNCVTGFFEVNDILLPLFSRFFFPKAINNDRGIRPRAE